MESTAVLYLLFCRYTHSAAAGATTTIKAKTTLEGASGGCVNVASIALPSVADSFLGGGRWWVVGVGWRGVVMGQGFARMRDAASVSLTAQDTHTHGALFATNGADKLFCVSHRYTDTGEPRRTKDTTQKTHHTHTHKNTHTHAWK